MNRREFLKFKAEGPDWKAREEAHAEAKERMRAYIRAYFQKPEVKERRRAYFQKPEVKERMRAYYQKHDQKPEVKERKRAYRRAYRSRDREGK